MKKTILLLLPLLFVISCSVQKRKYQKGFYISRKHASQKEKIADKAGPEITSIDIKQSKKALVPVPQQVLPAKEQEPVLAAAKNKMHTGIIRPKKTVSIFQQDSCDNMIFKDGSEIPVKVIEIAGNEIKYKKCEQSDGPVYVAKKSDVFMVKYANGTREVFNNQPNTVPQNVPGNPPRNYKAIPRTDPLAILALIFGVLGIYPLTGLGSIVAIILAKHALRRIKQQPDVYKGEAMARIGKALGMGVLILFAIILVAAIVVFLLLM